MSKTQYAGRNQGFTIVELIAIVAGLIILTIILVPACNTTDSPRPGRVSARIQELCNGCDAYRMDTGYYPGQMYPSMLAGNGGPYTGSQVLALCLFANLTMSSTGLAFPTDAYCSENVSQNKEQSDLFNPMGDDYPLYLSKSVTALSGTTATYSGWRDPKSGAAVEKLQGRPFTISDRYCKRPLPVLYYPARVDKKGFDQYIEADNAAYTLPGGPSRTGTTPENGKDFPSGFKTWITDPRNGNPMNSDRFLLFAAGKDGLYGTDDDIKNW